jgi:RND family efflux transporter MFP subunit
MSRAPWTSPRMAGARRLLVPGALVVLALAVSGCGLLPSEPVSLGQLSLKIPPQPPPPTITVQRGDVSETVQIAGQVTSTHVAQLYFPISGRLASLPVHDGEMVHRGQVLATLDSGGLIYQVQAAEDAVQQDELNIQAIRVQDQASPPTDAAAAQQQSLALAQAELSLQHDRQTLAQLVQQYDQNEIVAPFSGQVSQIANQLGDQITAFQPVMTLSDPYSEALVADIGNTTAAELHKGQAVQVTLNGSSGQQVSGRIVSLDVPSQAEVLQVEQSTDGNVVPTPTVTVALTGPKRPLTLGEPFSGLIVLAQAKNVLYVPSDVVRQLNGQDYVDVFRNGVVTQVPVTAGIQGNANTAILSGLREGEEIVQP